MAQGISLHIGLNSVDPKHYQGWDGKLAACEYDAKDMTALAKKRGFATETLLTKQGTSAAVVAGIKNAAKKLSKGDMFLLTYSGHGGQVRDWNRDEDNDNYDETWVLYDRQLVDDELYELFGSFKSGVRIAVLSDSCHSGTVVRAVPDFIEGGARVRAMPRSVGKKVESANDELYRDIQKAHKAAEDTAIGAHVLLVSGCQDNQYSLDGDRNGLFTETLRKVWKNGDFHGGYRTFRNQIAARMPASQTPNFFTAGTRHKTFERQTPFTI